MVSRRQTGLILGIALACALTLAAIMAARLTSHARVDPPPPASAAQGPSADAT
jgi:hypothetical protein